jgi:hypothetical protein
MRFLRLLVTTAALAAPLLVALSSQAQVVDATPKPEWSGRPPNGGSTPALINQPDCLDADAKVTFSVGVTGAMSSHKFEVWAGSDCGDLMQRDEENSCMKLEEATPTNDTKVEVLARDLVQPIKAGAGAGVGTDESCRVETEKTKRTLYFLLVDADRKQVGAGKWEFDYDLAPPAAPSNLTAGPGEQSLTLHFDAPKDENDAADYHLYCSELGAETGGAAGAPSTEVAADAGCTSSVLVAGQIPPEDHRCGTQTALGADSATTDMSLQNGVKYAVAITLVDGVGNESVLSNVACGTPEEVTGFYEAYRAAGGEAGGGFCSFAPGRRAAIPIGAALLIGCAALLRRRR